MDETPLKKAIVLAKAGDKAAARQILRQVVATDPDGENAWGWLAHCAETKIERRQALERVLEINPANEGARRAVEQLAPAPIVQAVAPPVVQVAQPQSYSPPPTVDDSHLLDLEIARLTTQGWQVVNRSPTGVQLRKPKQWSRLLLVISVPLICLYGIGILVFILALIDYLFKRDQLVHISITDIRRGTVEMPSAEIQSGKIIAVLLVIIIFALIWAEVIYPVIRAGA